MTPEHETLSRSEALLPAPLLLTAITPLRMIFWGGLMLLIDLTETQIVNGRGTRFDLLNDTVGTILITVGVFRLARLPVQGHFAAILRFVKVVCVLNILWTLDRRVVGPEPDWALVAGPLLGLAKLAAIVLFCTAMESMARASAFGLTAGSWATTRLLFIIIYAVPLGVLYGAMLVVQVTRRPLSLDLGGWATPMILVFLTPIIHLFVSTSRFKRAIEATRVLEGTGTVAP